MKLQGLNCGVAVNGMQAERMAREKEEEDEFRRQTMKRFAEQDRLEQMNAQKRRIKVAQHAREVERLIQEKRAMFEAAMVSTLSFVKASVNVLVKGFYPDMGFRCSPYNHHPQSFNMQDRTLVYSGIPGSMLLPHALLSTGQTLHHSACSTSCIIQSMPHKGDPCWVILHEALVTWHGMAWHGITVNAPAHTPYKSWHSESWAYLGIP